MNLFISASSQNLVCKQVATNQWFVLDSVWIEPGSLHLNNGKVLIRNDSIYILSEAADSKLCYRELSELLTKRRVNRALSSYNDSIATHSITSFQPPVQREELFNFPGVNKFGTISRGISFGNRQSILVNSSLNLQMEGQVADNLYLSAVITDQNIPYQPEGNTQQLRDFDNVFIKLYNDQFNVTAGDIVLENNSNNYFLKYYKNIQGLQVGYDEQLGKWKNSFKISGAASKGKFSSATIEPIDGITGPYRLSGPNGERFIIILANSEKVFLNGQIMKRGFDEDYIIDYNLGEITFNPHIVITQFSVINVDFEYAEQNYNRSNVAISEVISNRRIKIGFDYYRESDNPATNIGFNINNTDRQFLESIGDNLDLAFINSFDTISFSQNQILYEQIDTVDQLGNTVTIFQYSTNPNAVLYNPTFIDVGQGNGDYLLRESATNGRVYDWVSPFDGQSQGNYRAGALIPLPNKRELFSSQLDYKISKYESIKTEIAFSNTDNNLYSNLDDDDNQGIGHYLTIRSNNRPTFIKNYKLNAELNAEIDNINFTFIDRYRPILFERNWNSEFGEITKAKDHIFIWKFGLRKNSQNYLEYSSSIRDRGEVLSGRQHRFDLSQNIGAFYIKANSFTQNSKQFTSNTEWLKANVDVSFTKTGLVPGYRFEIDKNKVLVGDSIKNSLMSFHAHEVYLTNNDSSISNYRISYNRRYDQSALQGKLSPLINSDNYNAQYKKRLNNGLLSLDFNYRVTDDRQGTFTGQKEVINGRVLYNQSYLKNNVRQEFSYATGNSRELQREFVYIPVNPGEGTHTWRDVNEDGIQDLNEFFEAINPDERNFAKIFIPSDNYIIAFQSVYLHSINARFPSAWRRNTGLKKALSNFSSSINLNINFKTTSDNFNNRINPFALNLSSMEVLSASDSRRYTVFYNRNGRGFAADISMLNANNKNLLTQGFELRVREEVMSNIKMDLSSAYTIRFRSTLGKLSNASDFLDSRNFDLASNEYHPQLIWQPDNYLRIIGGYQWKKRFNELNELDAEQSTIKAITGELTWNKLGIGSIRSELNFLTIDFRGETNSYLGYLLLDGLQPGSNQTWQLSWQQKLSKGMQITLLYNGRKSEGRRVINTGTVQVTAFF